MNSQKMQPILSFPGYKITRDGKVWSDKSHKWLKTFVDGQTGYIMVNLCHSRYRYTPGIHRLLLEAFVGPCPEGMETRHLDGNRQNNDLSNLAWGTRSENRRDTTKHGKAGKKLTIWSVIWIKYLLSLQKFSQREIAGLFRVNPTSISDIKLGKTWVGIGR